MFFRRGCVPSDWEVSMIALIMAIAIQIGVDGRLAVEIAKSENSALDAELIGVTGDLGIMQLNPRYLDYFVG